ncbi:MAG: 4-(cytidine 5'-diphospho)-2-C-methyl-D-erythritol kinase [Acidimicrobiales bacterium]
MNEPLRPVVVRAPAKLTLTLRISNTQANGYHGIDAEMVTLDLCDELEITPAPASILVVAGRAAGVPTGPDNLVLRALDDVRRTARVRLTKRIPTEAGLGGGSADAAAVLRWAGVTDPVRAVRLGSDVAFCLVGGRARVTGTGESIEPLPFEACTVTLVFPPIACSTRRVFEAWDRLGGPAGPGGNDLELAALEVAPELRTWRDRLADDTGQRPHLAGSGSTWFVHGSHPGDGRLVAHAVPAGWGDGHR